MQGLYGIFSLLSFVFHSPEMGIYLQILNTITGPYLHKSVWNSPSVPAECKSVKCFPPSGFGPVSRGAPSARPAQRPGPCPEAAALSSVAHPGAPAPAGLLQPRQLFDCFLVTLLCFFCFQLSFHFILRYVILKRGCISYSHFTRWNVRILTWRMKPSTIQLLDLWRPAIKLDHSLALL